MVEEVIGFWKGIGRSIMKRRVVLGAWRKLMIKKVLKKEFGGVLWSSFCS